MEQSREMALAQRFSHSLAAGSVGPFQVKSYRTCSEGSIKVESQGLGIRGHLLIACRSILTNPVRGYLTCRKRRGRVIHPVRNIMTQARDVVGHVLYRICLQSILPGSISSQTQGFKRKWQTRLPTFANLSHSTAYLSPSKNGIALILRILYNVHFLLHISEMFPIPRTVVGP